MIIESNIENYFVGSEIDVSEINSNLQQDTVYSEELEYTAFAELLRITQQSAPRITSDNEFRILQ